MVKMAGYSVSHGAFDSALSAQFPKGSLHLLLTSG